MDRVVVARHASERAHIGRGDDHGVAATTTRGLDDVVAQRTTRADRIGQFGGAGAATDRETLDQGRNRGVARAVADVGGDGHVDLDDTAQIGVGDILDLRLDTQDRRIGGQTVLHIDRVIEMNEIEHALDDRQILVGAGSTERGEHSRPARAHEDVGHTDGARTQVLRQTRTGDTGVVGDLLRQQPRVMRAAPFLTVGSS